MPETIRPQDLVCMNNLQNHTFRVDLVYANPGHPENIFKVPIYRPDAQLYLHERLARIVLCAARAASDQLGWRLVLKDGLRTMDAQALMVATPIVRAHPQWLVEPRLLSGPGQGGHPRAMAVDITVEEASSAPGTPVDMGTSFDDFSGKAHRSHPDFPAHVRENRAQLERLMVAAGKEEGTPIRPLPQEWWDFRFFPDFLELYAPLADNELPPEIKMCAQGG